MKHHWIDAFGLYPHWTDVITCYESMMHVAWRIGVHVMPDGSHATHPLVVGG